MHAESLKPLVQESSSVDQQVHPDLASKPPSLPIDSPVGGRPAESNDQDPEAGSNSGSKPGEAPLTELPRVENENSNAENSQLQTIQVPPTDQSQDSGFLAEPAFWFWAIPLLLLPVLAFAIRSWLTRKNLRPIKKPVEKPVEKKEVLGQFAITHRFRAGSAGVNRASFDKSLDEFDQQHNPKLKRHHIQTAEGPIQIVAKLSHSDFGPDDEFGSDDVLDFSAEIEEKQIVRADARAEYETVSSQAQPPGDELPGIKDDLLRNPLGPANSDAIYDGHLAADTSVKPLKSPSKLAEPFRKTADVPATAMSEFPIAESTSRPREDEFEFNEDGDAMLDDDDSVFDSDLTPDDSNFDPLTGNNLELEEEIRANEQNQDSVDPVENASPSICEDEEAVMNLNDDDSDLELNFDLDTDVELEDSDANLGFEPDDFAGDDISKETADSASAAHNPEEDQNEETGIDANTLSIMDDDDEFGEMFEDAKGDLADSDNASLADQPDAADGSLNFAFETSEKPTNGELTVAAAYDESVDSMDDDAFDNEAEFKFDSIDEDDEPSEIAPIEASALGRSEPISLETYATKTLADAGQPSDDSESISDSVSKPAHGMPAGSDNFDDVNQVTDSVGETSKGIPAAVAGGVSPTGSFFSRLLRWFKKEPEGAKEQLSDANKTQNQDYASVIIDAHTTTTQQADFADSAISESNVVGDAVEPNVADFALGAPTLSTDDEEFDFGDSPPNLFAEGTQDVGAAIDPAQTVEATIGRVDDEDSIDQPESTRMPQEQQTQLLDQIDRLTKKTEVLNNFLKSVQFENGQLVQTTQKIQETTELLTDSERANSELQAELVSIKMQLKDESSKLADYVKEQEQAQAKLQSEIDSAKLQLENEASRIVARLEEEASAKAIHQSELDSEKMKLATESARVADRLADSELANTSLRSELDAMKMQQHETATVADRLEVAEQSNTALRSDLDAMKMQQHETAAVADRLEVAEQSNTALRSKVDSMNAKLETETAKLAELDGLRSQLASLSQENATISIEFELVKSELAKMETGGLQTSSIVDGASELTPGTIAKSSDSVDEPQEVDPQLFDRFEKRLKAEYRKRKSAQRHLAQAENQRDEIAKALRDARHELKDKVETSSTVESKLVETNKVLAAEIELANQTHDSIKSEHDSLKLSLEKVTAENSELVKSKVELDSESNAHAEKTSNLESLKSEIEKLKKTLNERNYDAENDRLNAEIDQQHAQQEELQRLLAIAEKHHEDTVTQLNAAEVTWADEHEQISELSLELREQIRDQEKRMLEMESKHQEALEKIQSMAEESAEARFVNKKTYKPQE